MKALYVSYFGALKHLSKSQIIPYLRGLVRDGVEVWWLSFEERLPDPAEERRQRKAVAAELERQGIAWTPLRYHKRPSLLATVYDTSVGVLVAAYLVVRHRIDVIHVRNHIPALIGLAVRRLVGAKLLFDLRGVMAEEYVEAGVWSPGSLPFRLVKWVEAQALGSADAIVMLTRRIHSSLRDTSAELRANPAPVEVIPCCVDLGCYRGEGGRAVRTALGLESATIMVYAGSLGGWYMVSEMVDFFIAAQHTFPRLHFLVLTQSPHEILDQELDRRGVAPSRYSVRTVPSSSMPEHLAAADFGISFIRPGYSKRSSSPTKIGEYLASGLPVVTNAGIGDLDDLLQGETVGALVSAHTPEAYQSAATCVAVLLGDREATRTRCRAVAARQLSLESVGWPAYLRIYRYLSGASGPETRVGRGDVGRTE